MFKKSMVVLFSAMILVVGLNALVLAQDKPIQTTPTTTPEKIVKPAPTAISQKAAPAKEAVTIAPVKEKSAQMAKEEMPKAMPMRPGMHRTAANMIGVCSCGMTFEPTAATKYFTYNTKEYATCSDHCFQNAEKDPAAAVKKIDGNIAKVMSPPMHEMK